MLSRHHQIALVDRALERVLVVPTDGGAALPRTDQRWPDHRDLVRELHAPGALLIGQPWREDDGLVTDVLLGDESHLDGATWHPLDRLDELDLRESSKDGLRRVVREWRDGAPDDGRAAWWRRGWFEAVVAWVDEQLPLHGLARSAPPEPVKLWSLSAVICVPVTGSEGAASEVWFKATCDGFRTEPALTEAVCQLAPELTPRVLAVDADRAWMLMESIPGAGEGVEAARAVDVARALARLQLDSLDHTDTLRAAGAVDRGLDATLAGLSLVLRESVERPLMTPEQRAAALEAEGPLTELVRDFWSHGLPDVLAHGDLHLGNAAWVDDRPVFFDWTDLCLTHPFLDARHLAQDAGGDGPDADERRQQVWEAYAEAWRTAYPDVDLDRAWAQSRQVNRIFQMISYEQIYRAQPESSRWELSTILVEYLDAVLADLRGR